tara:strand:- start:78 stop:638 length:561 start_codon:yes stop_codon:yes gene_type:complete
MSAYIVNRETIDAIVDSIMDPPQSGCFGGFDPYLFDPIVKAGPTGFKGDGFARPKKTYRADYGSTIDPAAQRAWGTWLGRVLWSLNLDAVKARYPGDRDGQRPGPNDFRDCDVQKYEWKRSLSRNGFVSHGRALVTAWGSWEYQCHEGDVPERPVFQALMAARGRLAARHLRDVLEANGTIDTAIA